MRLVRKPYNVKVCVRNNLLLQAVRDMGFESQAAFARFAGMTVGELNAMVALRTAPISNSGEFTRTAKTLMEVLGACPSDLWTEEQLTMRLARNTAETTFSNEEMRCFLATGRTPVQIDAFEDVIESKQFSERVRELAFDGTLTPLETKVLKLRLGIDGVDCHTFEEVSKILDRSRERVRQIEAKALRKLRMREKIRPTLTALINGSPVALR